MDFFDRQLEEFAKYTGELDTAYLDQNLTNHARRIGCIGAAFRNLVGGYKATERRLKTITAQLRGKACEHPRKLVMGREEAGGRRFPLVWCQDCGAIKFDSHCEILPGTPESQFILPEREKATAGRFV